MSSWLWCHHHDLVFINVLVSFHTCFGCNEKEVLIWHSLHSTSSQKSKEKLFSMMKCFSRWMITSSPARSFSLCVCVCVCVSVPLWVSLCHFRSLPSVSAHIDRAALEGYHVLRLRQGHWCRTFHFLPNCETNDCASYVDQMLRWQRKLIHKWLPKCICKQIMSFQRASCSCLRQQRRNWNKYFHHFVIAT